MLIDFESYSDAPTDTRARRPFRMPQRVSVAQTYPPNRHGFATSAP
jgi:hypothetical protein